MHLLLCFSTPFFFILYHGDVVNIFAGFVVDLIE